VHLLAALLFAVGTGTPTPLPAIVAKKTTCPKALYKLSGQPRPARFTAGSATGSRTC